ncbi:hypothetical protein [Breznakia pachnodae]|uniref:Uncharacterized protein n=1 Tax=Breznakia pachnodae TaxID=265178 RepID=A0ABU0E6Q5_9FIRM|nr:hypothetical protein [Breznakia pachnodae]MDQ0362501.1 hypothetical protein [Breznakia pachnodae]
MKKNNLMKKWNLSGEELNAGFKAISVAVSEIKNSRVMNAIADFMENGDVRVSELDVEGNGEGFLIGDIVKVNIDVPRCGMVRIGTYIGVVVDHYDVGLCIALHDMNLIVENAVECYYPQFMQASAWEEYEIELLYRVNHKNYELVLGEKGSSKSIFEKMMYINPEILSSLRRGYYEIEVGDEYIAACDFITPTNVLIEAGDSIECESKCNYIITETKRDVDLEPVGEIFSCGDEQIRRCFILKRKAYE